MLQAWLSMSLPNGHNSLNLVPVLLLCLEYIYIYIPTYIAYLEFVHP